MKSSSKIGLVLVLILLCTTLLVAQTTLEEGIRQDFVKKLKKARDKNKKEADKKSGSNQIAVSNSEAKPTETDDEVITVETQLVRSDILVFDPKGIAVLGLKAEDFEITEDKIQQEIGTFSLGDSADVPRTIVLIIDYSGSQRPYIKTSVAAAKVLVDKLNPRDRMAIVTDDIELITDFSRDKEELKKSLDKLVKKAERGEIGKSLQYSALYAVINEMFSSEDIRPIIIFQTDGDQLSGLRKANSFDQIILPNATSFTDIQLMNSIEKSRATIYSVISGYSLLGLNQEEREKKTEFSIKQNSDKKNKPMRDDIVSYSATLFREQSSMAAIAKLSGGFSENLETPEQADKVYENILNGITNRYLIGYYPTNPTSDGKRRTIKITIKNHPEYTIWGRKTYYTIPTKK